MLLRSLLAAALLTAPGVTPAGTPPGAHWEPVSDLWDDFNGTRLDPARWDVRNLHYKGKPPAMFIPDNVEVGGGELKLWARPGTVPNAPARYHSFTGASITSRSMIQYGYLEVRAQAMRATVVNAFWLYRWTPNSTYELDVFEIAAAARGNERTVHTNAHVYYGPPELESDRNRISDPRKHEIAAAPAESFHVYGFEWDRDQIKWYVDGVLIRSRPNDHWHAPMTIKLSAETHPDWFGLPGADELPAAFRVDYVRVWKRTAGPAGTMR